MKERSMPICFTADQYEKIERVAKQKGMLNGSQLIEEILPNSKNQQQYLIFPYFNCQSLLKVIM